MLQVSLPYLALPYGEDVLPPSAEASNGPNAHPRINRKDTKSPNAVLTWVHTNTWNHPQSPSQVRAYSLGPTYYIVTGVIDVGGCALLGQ